MFRSTNAYSLFSTEIYPVCTCVFKEYKSVTTRSVVSCDIALFSLTSFRKKTPGTLVQVLHSLRIT